MCRLQYISSMDIIVIGNISVVVALEGHHEGDECVCWDLKALQ